MTARFKSPSFVSQRFRDFARGQECALRMPWCLGGTETVVLCHMRFFGNAGIGQKPHDFHGYHGCAECHRREREAGFDDLLRALMETQSRLYAAGLLIGGKR